MTLKTSLLFAFAAITLTSMTAGAFIVRAPGAGVGPRPVDPRVPPQQPDFPFPPEDDFGNGGIPSGRQERKIIYLNRRIYNETLALRQLAGIGENYRGFTVQSVEVELRGTDYNTQISLLADGREEDTAYSPQSSVQLYPRSRAVLGEDIRSLQLAVRGVADIASIAVTLVDTGRVDRPDRPGRPGYPGQGMTIPLNISRRLYGNGRLDLNQYVDMYRYRGQRIQEIVIEATPVYNSALIDLVINGFNQGQTLQVDRYNTRQSIRPQNAVIGYGADSLVLFTRGDLDIRTVTLRLSR